MNCYLVISTATSKVYLSEKTKTKVYEDYFYGESEEEVRLQFEEKNKTAEIKEIKKRDYIILSESSPEWLEKKVNTFIGKGWKLLGGVSVGIGGADNSAFIFRYVQSLEWGFKSCK